MPETSAAKRPRTRPVDQLRVLGRGATKACGVCGRRRLFRRWVHMEEHCPRCGLKFEREEGAFVGAVGINTIISFGLLLLGMIVFFIATYPDIPTGPWVFLAALAYAPIPFFLYPFSKTIWLAIDLLMRPVTDDEIKPRDEWT